MSNHKIVDGITVDGLLYTTAEKAIAKSSDGRISLDNARKLFENVIDGDIYTQVEEDTVSLILRNMSWQPEAREWFLKELAKWKEQETQIITMSPEALSKELFPKKDILEEEFDRVYRGLALRSAASKNNGDSDETTLIVRLADGRRTLVKAKIEEFGNEVIGLLGGHDIPVRAIERVMSYHKVVDGIRVDGPLYLIAEKAIAKSADGQLSLDDAQDLFENVIDEGIYSQVEEDTVNLILRNMAWRSDAREWFLRHLASWKEKEMQSTPMSPEAVSKEHFPKEDVHKEEFDRVYRQLALRSATMKTYDEHEEITLIVRLADSRRIQVKSRFVELENEFVELFGGVVIPLKAIERVEF